MARLPHARHDDAAPGREDEPVRGEELLAQARLDVANGFGLDVEDVPRELEEVLGVGDLVRL